MKLQELFESTQDITQSPEFKKWFGNSKVVKGGKPLMVYHGTNSPFDIFDLNKAGSNNDPGMFGKGFYFSPDKSMSKSYGDNIMKLYLSIQNPFIITKGFGSIPEHIRNRLEVIKSHKLTTKDAQTMRAEFIAMGYDGVMHYEGGDKNKLGQIVAFYPNQIKSVNNNGNFSSSENINEEEEIDMPEIKVGDTVKVGKWKNKKVEVKGSKVDADGQTFLKTNKGDKRLFNFKTMNESTKHNKWIMIKDLQPHDILNWYSPDNTEIEFIEFGRETPKSVNALFKRLDTSKEIGGLSNKRTLFPYIRNDVTGDNGRTFYLNRYGDPIKTITESQNIEGGKADDMTIEDIANIHSVSVEQIQGQLDLGIEIEMEHTTDEEIAKEISMDHLVEFPDYYDRLIAMEQQAEEK